MLFEHKDAADSTVVSDRHGLILILTNLISNALKFTPDSGTVSISIVDDGPAGTKTVTVSDTGPGIDPRDLVDILEPYRRGRAATMREKDGTGLGLSICNRLAALLKMDLEIASEIGAGTTVTLVIPNRLALEEGA